MIWWKPLSFTEARAAKGQGITVPGAQLHGGVPITLHEGKTFRFSTRNIDGTGLVLEVDHALDFAIILQYNAPNGDRRIVRFNPGEFMYLKEFAVRRYNKSAQFLANGLLQSLLARAGV